MSKLSSALAGLGYADWTCERLRGDASARQFFRLCASDGQTRIVMITPPDQLASQTAFVTIAAALRGHGLCAPEVLAHHVAANLLVLDDLGPKDIACTLAAHPNQELHLYKAAIDVVLRLQDVPPPDGLIPLTADIAVQMLDPFFDYYAPVTSDLQRRDIANGMRGIMAETFVQNGVLALRDYHAENLIWRPNRKGTDRIGVLDFQDAFVAPPEYDLVSLLRDARRDVSALTHAASLNYFADKTGQTVQTTAQRCAVLGVQRNLRILGVFARLAQRDGKSGYLTLVPRVVRHVLADLETPAMAPLRALLAPLLMADR